MKEYGATKLIGILGVTGGLAILLGFSAERSHSTTPTVKVPPYRMKHLCNNRAAARFGLIPFAVACSFSVFRIVALYPPLLKIVIHEQQMPAGRSRQKPCVRQHSNTMALRIFVDSGSTSCQCQCNRSKTWNNTRA